MTTDLDKALDGVADLAAAFATKDVPQDAGKGSQDGEGVGTPTDNSRDPDRTTDDSRVDIASLKDSLAKLEPDALVSLAKQVPALKSWADKEAAAQLTGMRASVRKELEPQLREQIELEIAKSHFESLDREALADELTDPDAAKLFGKVSAMPPPVATDSRQEYYARIIQNYGSKLPELSQELRNELDPSKFLMQQGVDPDELVSRWTSRIDEEVVNARVSKATAPKAKAQQESEEIDQQAKEDARNPQTTPILPGGRIAPPLPQVDDPNTTGESLLSQAFAVQRSTRR